jgi:hypothetical protein
MARHRLGMADPIQTTQKGSVMPESTQERRVRRLTREAGYRLWKPRSVRYAEYWPYTLINAEVNGIMYHYKGRSLDEIEEFVRSKL